MKPFCPLVAMLVVVSALSSACTNPPNSSPDQNDTTSAARPDTTTPDTTGTQAASDDSSTTWTHGIVDQSMPGEGTAILQAVRTGEHDDFDRVVFEFSNNVLPGYHLEYIDKPVRQCGSGNTVELAGDGWLEVRMSPSRAHTETGDVTISNRERSLSLPVLKELELTCDFEANVTWVLGLGSPNNYRLLKLRDPARLVVDVRHE